MDDVVLEVELRHVAAHVGAVHRGRSGSGVGVDVKRVVQHVHRVGRQQVHAVQRAAQIVDVIDRVVGHQSGAGRGTRSARQVQNVACKGGGALGSAQVVDAVRHYFKTGIAAVVVDAVAGTHRRPRLAVNVVVLYAEVVLAVGIDSVEVKVVHHRVSYRVVRRTASHRQSSSIEAEAVVTPDDLARVDQQIGRRSRLSARGSGRRLGQRKCRVVGRGRGFACLNHAALKRVVVGVVAQAHAPARGGTRGVNDEVFEPQKVGAIEVERMALVGVGRRKREGVVVALHRNGVGRRHARNLVDRYLLVKRRGIGQHLKDDRSRNAACRGREGRSEGWVGSARADGIGSAREVGQGGHLHGR